MLGREHSAVDLEEAREVIRRLSPGRLCRGALPNLRDFLTDVAGVVGDVFRAILALILLGAGLGSFVPMVLSALAGSAVGGGFKQLLKWLAGKVGEPGSEVVKCFMEFINTAREASRYIDYEEVQGIVSDVAREWGMGTNAFKNLVRGFASLMEGRFVTEDEVRRLFENGLKKVEELEVKVDELNNWINILKQEFTANIIIAGKVDFEQGIIYPNIKVKNSELRIRVEDRYHNVVRAGRFNELISDVESKLMGNGAVVVVGPKGIGKSTLAAAVIWELFMNGDIGLVARVDALDSKNYSEFATFVENYGERFSEYFGRLLILYDPVSTEAYERVDIDVKAPIQTNIERTIKDLMNAIKSISSEASKPLILIVIPSDVYNALSGEMRNALEMYRLDVSQALSNREFLAELIREYSKTKDKPNGCELSNDMLSKLADELAKFDSGHALIARLIGEELARSNCDVGKIEELINNAKGKAEAFIILHINGLFKVHEDPDTAKALVEIFALRKPFIDSARPGDPILTPGIIELIGEKKGASLLQSAEGGELRGWLAIRQHDLIEDSIEGLLRCIADEGEECKKFDDELLEPWRDVHVPKIRSRTDAVKYFTRKYGKRLIKKLRRHKNCWKRAALIIGHALAGDPIVPRLKNLSVFLPENLRNLSKSDIEFLGYALSRLGFDVDKIPSLIMNLSKYSASVVEFLGDALKECGVDYYLFVGDEIPPLIRYLTKDYAYALAEAFVDRYNEVVAEVRRVLNIIKNRSDLHNDEVLYSLGLALIIANTAGLGRPIEPSDADATLHIASFAIQDVVSPIFIMPILRALKPLRGKAPHRYLELLATASVMANLDLGTVRYIFKELNGILDNYGDVVKGHAWSLVHAIIAYAVPLRGYLVYFSYGEIENMVGRVVGLLNELGRFKSSLGVIAWAHALAPALIHGGVRVLMKEKLGINVVRRASEVLDELSGLRKKVKDLMRDEEFMSYIESKYIKADEGAVRKEILEAASHLKHELAQYRLKNDELDKAEELFNEVAKEYREIGDYEGYLANCGWVLRVEAINGSLAGDELIKLRNEFQRLYEETFSKEYFKPTAWYLSAASLILGSYLVSLALTGNYEKIDELLEEHLWVLNADRRVSVLTRLTLNALLRPRGELNSELKGRLSVNPGELINAFETDMLRKYLPALMVVLGIAKPEDGIKLCEEFNDEVCVGFVLAVKENSAVIEWLRELLINAFREVLIVRLNSFKELGVDIDTVLNEFMELVYGLDGKSLVRLITPVNSRASLAFMLYALINGEEELAKAHALYGAPYYGKLLGRLFLEAYKACCDLNDEGFRRAIAKLFFYHV